MIEIHPRLWVGSEADYASCVRGCPGWSVVQACKEPYHRQALGYATKSAPRGHHEYLVARRDSRLILNLVDAPDPAYVPKLAVDAALEFIHQELTASRKVLIHCNQGRSRSPAIAMLYLARHDEQFQGVEFAAAERRFHGLYPPYGPGSGMRGFLQRYWQAYAGT